nr:hypothetical protein CFP56_46482 [Quercus suber]
MGREVSSCKSGLRWISPRLSHSAKSCGQMRKRLRSVDSREGELKKDDQQYGEFLRIDPMRQTRKMVVVVSGTSRGAKLWKKGPVIDKNQLIHKGLINQEGSASNYKRDNGTDKEVNEMISMEVKPTGVVFSSHTNPLNVFSNGIDANTINLDNGIEEVRDSLPTLMAM